MKQHGRNILTGAACVLLAVTAFQNYQLMGQIEQMENRLSQRIGNVEHSVQNITSNIRHTMEERMALLIEEGWRFEAADIENGWVIAVLEVVPKEYHPEKTRAAILCGDVEYPMELENGVYRANVEIPLFQETRVSSVAFEEDGTIRREALNWALTPRYDFLPIVYAYYAGGTTGSPRDGVYSMQFDGDIQIDIEHLEGEDAIRSITLVEMLDDAVITETEIPMERWNDENQAHHEAAGEGRTSGSAPAMRINPGSRNRVSDHYDFEMEQKNVRVPYGSTYHMFVDVEDAYGLIHRSTLYREVIDDTGSRMDDHRWEWDGAEARIYRADGEPLGLSE